MSYNDKMPCMPTNPEVIQYQLWDNSRNERTLNRWSVPKSRLAASPGSEFSTYVHTVCACFLVRTFLSCDQVCILKLGQPTGCKHGTMAIGSPEFMQISIVGAAWNWCHRDEWLPLPVTPQSFHSRHSVGSHCTPGGVTLPLGINDRGVTHPFDTG